MASSSTTPACQGGLTVTGNGTLTVGGGRFGRTIQIRAGRHFSDLDTQPSFTNMSDSEHEPQRFHGIAG